jgi:hypothetical protein
MIHSYAHTAGRAATTLFALLATCVGLAACGGSSGSTSSTAATSTSAATKGGSTAAIKAHLASLHQCLAQQGITLVGPGGSPSASVVLGVGAKLPSGVTREQYEAAFRKCSGARLTSTSPAYTAVLTRYVACMRSHGVNLPPPNTSGAGPVLDTKGVNTRGAAYKAALAKCARLLQRAISAGPEAGASLGRSTGTTATP